LWVPIFLQGAKIPEEGYQFVQDNPFLFIFDCSGIPEELNNPRSRIQKIIQCLHVQNQLDRF
jgi:hypothetical protein